MAPISLNNLIHAFAAFSLSSSSLSISFQTTPLFSTVFSKGRALSKTEVKALNRGQATMSKNPDYDLEIPLPFLSIRGEISSSNWCSRSPYLKNSSSSRLTHRLWTLIGAARCPTSAHLRAI